MSVVTVSEVKAHLNITTGDFDGELADLIDAAEAAISQVVGPLEAVTVTSSVRGGGSTMVLPVSPVLSLTSLTSGEATVVDTAGVYVNTDAGMIEMESGALFANLRHTIVYQAGRTTIPADLALAVKELVRHYWTTQRGGSKKPGSSPSEAYSNTIPGAAYAMPFRVSELLAPHRTISAA